MKTIVFAATKGGTGKSTLAFNVGIEAAKHGSVYWLDLDPQKSLTTLAEARDRQGDLLAPVLLSDAANALATIRDLDRVGMLRDFMVVDTPGSHMPIIRNALLAADVIVLPCQPSPLDILAQEDVAPLIDEIGKAAQTLFVINKIDGRSPIDDTIERITPLFPNQPVKVHQRIAYIRAAIRGDAASELNPKDCGPEMERLWSAITAIIGKTDAKNQHEGSAASRVAQV